MNREKFIGMIVGFFMFVIMLVAVAAVSSMNLTTTQAPRQLANNPLSMDAAIRATVGKYTMPYQVDEATAGTVYIRYSSSAGSVHILKSVTATSVTTYTRAYDAWTNRATASYLPVNN